MTLAHSITLTVELTPNQAAAPIRLANKISHTDALAVLYPHVGADVRAEQASDILSALARVEKALADLDVRAWPWIETGRARRVDPIRLDPH